MSANLLVHHQIPALRCIVQVWLPALGAPLGTPIPRSSATYVPETLLQQGWSPERVLQMPREKYQPVPAELPRTLKRAQEVTPPAWSPLLVDNDVQEGLKDYFLTARLPLTRAQMQHLDSAERLRFGSAPLPEGDRKRPWPQLATRLDG